MKLRNHFRLLGLAVAVWSAFWLAGLPDYYQQHSAAAVGVGSTVLSVAISLVALAVLARCNPRRRMQRAFWLALYFTLPFALLDYGYCGVYLGKGIGFWISYWYLSVFYLTPWLTFVPTAWLLNRPGAGLGAPGDDVRS